MTVPGPDSAAAEWRSLNQANWDERVPVHRAVPFYDLQPLRAGNAKMNAIEEAELGPVAGLRVLHLQCHFGNDSLILASRGASVTGLDFSPAAIEAAQQNARDLGLDARFVLSDLYAAREAIPEPASFDLVYITWGTICWLPDVVEWARIIAYFLRPGGRLYFADFHPAATVLDDSASPPDGRPAWFAPYFDPNPLVIDDHTDYADPDARLQNPRTIQWLHPLASIVTALLAAGLRLDRLSEHPRIAWKAFACLVRDADGCWTWPDRPWFPLALSLGMTKS
ncbi:class I SAM-dependent methyltransferase [Acidisphaera sp. L21]|uniref:class I SAM-dependent methyltransferase n=1 Tax=Acidisphaera sp. L21 TaxID=1641851 RepID=UPI00131E4E2B|nr:class I SAM-dependent methyltransferase [Acidisphaera sp. L21]